MKLRNSACRRYVVIFMTIIKIQAVYRMNCCHIVWLFISMPEPLLCELSVYTAYWKAGTTFASNIKHLMFWFHRILKIYIYILIRALLFHINRRITGRTSLRIKARFYWLAEASLLGNVARVAFQLEQRLPLVLNLILCCAVLWEDGPLIKLEQLGIHGKFYITGCWTSWTEQQ